MDRRIKYTKKVITDTLLELLAKKDIKKITVSEICKIADINRATFYRYYLDIYDLVDKIKSELVDELKNMSAINDNTDYSVSSFTREMLTVFIEHKELVKILFNTQSNVFFLTDIFETAYEKCEEKWRKDIPSISDEEIEYATTFIFNGAIGIINYWVQNDFDKDIDEIANIIEKLSYSGINRFIYSRH